MLGRFCWKVYDYITCKLVNYLNDFHSFIYLLSNISLVQLIHVMPLLFICRQLMPATLDGQLTIEKTPSYFVTRDVPEKVYDMSPTVKLIVVVKDPVNR